MLHRSSLQSVEILSVNMKRIVLITILLAATATPGLSSAETTPTLKQFLALCKQEALARGIKATDLEAFVGKCVKSKESTLNEEIDDPVIAAARISC